MPKFEMVVQGDCKKVIVELEKQLLDTGIATRTAAASAFFIDHVLCVVEVFNSAPMAQMPIMDTDMSMFGELFYEPDGEIPSDSAMSITVSMAQGKDDNIYVSCFVAGEGVFLTKLPHVKEYLVMNRVKQILKYL